MPGEDKEAKTMTEEDTRAKVERLLQERKEKEEQTKTLNEIKAFCKLFPELCESQKRLEEKVDGLEQKPSEPKHLRLHGKETKHFETPDLYRCCDSDEGKCSTNELCAEIPPSLRAKMLRVFCNDPECLEENEKDGFELEGKGYREKGGSSFLGG